MLQGRLNTVINHEFFYWKKCGPIVLPLLGEESKVLFDLLVHPFSLSIRLRVVHSYELAIDTEFLI